MFVLLFPQDWWPGVAYLGNDEITYIYRNMERNSIFYQSTSSLSEPLPENYFGSEVPRYLQQRTMEKDMIINLLMTLNLTYSTSSHGGHRATTFSFHLVLSWSFLFASPHVVFMACSSAKNYGERQNSNQST
jgi:hypothetical protein